MHEGMGRRKEREHNGEVEGGREHNMGKGGRKESIPVGKGLTKKNIVGERREERNKIE